MTDAKTEVPPDLGRHGLLLGVAGASDYPAIETLSRAAAQSEVASPLTAPLISWFVDRNPCGPGFIVLARDAETREIAGHFVFYAWSLRQRVAGGDVTERPAFLYVRLYVRPEYRRRGTFAAMTTFGLDRLRHMSIPFAYTAPNPRSSPGFVKLGMHRLGPLPFYVRPAAAAWKWLLAPRVRGVVVERRPRFDETFERAFETSLPAGVSLWSPRSAARLNWRYVDRPDVAYEIRYFSDERGPIGFVVTRRMTIKQQDVVALCDFWVERGRERALGAAVDDALAANRGVRAVIAIGAAASPVLTAALRRAAFVRCPAPLLPQPVLLFGGDTGAASPGADWPAADAWHITPYDWDVF